MVRHPGNNDSGSFGFFAGISVTVGPFCFVTGTVAVGLISFLFYVVCLFFNRYCGSGSGFVCCFMVLYFLYCCF